MLLLVVLIPCLVAGVGFAYIAAWLTTKRGNTLADIANAQQLANVEAIRVEILDKVKVTSNLPIVALYLVAFAVAIGLPAFVVWQAMRDAPVITLSGEINRASDTTLCVMPKDMQIEPSGSFALPVMYSSALQTINFEGEHFHPLTMRISVNKLKNSLLVEVTNVERFAPREVSFDWSSRKATLDTPIVLSPVGVPVAPAVPNRPSPASPVSPEFEAAGSPPGIAQ